MAAYSPAARRVNEDLERVGEIGVPVTLLTPPGVDPVPYAALVHGAAKLRPGAFLVVDAADARDRLLSTWSDPESSPLRLADGGTLCILAVGALPVESQAFLAAALAERRAPQPSKSATTVRSNSSSLTLAAIFSLRNAFSVSPLTISQPPRPSLRTGNELIRSSETP